MQPRVAVVIPCHDDGALAVEAVRSIREDEPVELVIVDDGSKDPATAVALEGLRGDGVRLLRQQNAGLGSARMAGVEATTAPFVFPLDADDLLEPCALGALADALQNAPDAAFAWGDYVLFGDYAGTYRAPRRFLPWSLTYVNQYPVSSLVRRSALETTGGWRMRAYEDWDLWLSFIDFGLGGVAIDRIVYRRRLHGAQRLLGGARGGHRQLYAELRRRHPDTFSRRRELRRREQPPGWKRLVYPVLFGRRATVPYSLEAWMQRTMMRHGIRLSR